MTCNLVSGLDAAPQMPYSLYTSYKESFVPSTRHCASSLSIWNKVFDRARVIWWDLHKLRIEVWLVWLIQSMCEKARSRVRVGCNASEEFNMKVGIHQGPFLSPLLFFTILKAMPQDFHARWPWENLHADDRIIAIESSEELQERLIIWKTNMEGKGLRVNVGKTKVLMSRPGLDVLQKSGKDPYSVWCVSQGRQHKFHSLLWSSVICAGNAPARLISDHILGKSLPLACQECIASWASYHIHKLRIAHAPGMPGTFFPPLT